MGHIYTNRPSLGNPVKQSGEENAARWQVRVLRWREKLFELLEGSKAGRAQSLTSMLRAGAKAGLSIGRPSALSKKPGSEPRRPE